MSSGTVKAVRGFTAGAFRILLISICCAVLRIDSSIVEIFIRSYHGARSGNDWTATGRTRDMVQEAGMSCIR